VSSNGLEYLGGWGLDRGPEGVVSFRPFLSKEWANKARLLVMDSGRQLSRGLLRSKGRTLRNLEVRNKGKKPAAMGVGTLPGEGARVT